VLAKGLLALGASGDADAVFGPAEDGGFWALGLREPGHPRVSGLLVGVPMSRDDHRQAPAPALSRPTCASASCRACATSTRSGRARGGPA